MGWYILIFWITLMPFVIWKGYFESPKVFIFLIGGFSLSIYWIQGFIRNPHLFKLERKDVWFWIWLLILTISSLFGVHPLNSIIGGSYRHQGVIFFIALWLTGKTIGLLEVKKKKLLYRCIGLAVIVESLIVLYQIAFGKLYLGNPLGTLGEVNAIAGFLAIGSYFVCISYPKVISLLPLIGIFLTQSKSGILAVVPNLFCLVDSTSRKKNVLLVGFALVSILIMLFYFSSGKGTSFFENRQTIWPLAIQQIINKPILGYGAESNEVVFNKAFYVAGFPLSDLIIDRAHNLFLDIAIWSGAAGLATFSVWLYFSYIDIKDVGRKLALISFLIFSMFQPLGVAHWVLLMIILAT